jgi:hypothetical protein
VTGVLFLLSAIALAVRLGRTAERLNRERCESRVAPRRSRPLIPPLTPGRSARSTAAG